MPAGCAACIFPAYFHFAILYHPKNIKSRLSGEFINYHSMLYTATGSLIAGIA
jgi:hypothetical protein